jgi:hypothetical protein
MFTVSNFFTALFDPRRPPEKFEISNTREGKMGVSAGLSVREKRGRSIRRMKGGGDVLTSFIAVFLRVRKVIGLPFPLLHPELRHHVPLQLQLEALVGSRVRLQLLLYTRVLPHVVVFALVQSPGAHERSPALPAAPGGAFVHRDAQQLCRVDVFEICRVRTPAMTKVLEICRVRTRCASSPIP